MSFTHFRQCGLHTVNSSDVCRKELQYKMAQACLFIVFFPHHYADGKTLPSTYCIRLLHGWKQHLLFAEGLLSSLLTEKVLSHYFFFRHTSSVQIIAIISFSLTKRLFFPGFLWCSTICMPYPNSPWCVCLPHNIQIRINGLKWTRRKTRICLDSLRNATRLSQICCQIIILMKIDFSFSVVGVIYVFKQDGATWVPTISSDCSLRELFFFFLVFSCACPFMITFLSGRTSILNSWEFESSSLVAAALLLEICFGLF